MAAELTDVRMHNEKDFSSAALNTSSVRGEFNSGDWPLTRTKSAAAIIPISDVNANNQFVSSNSNEGLLEVVLSGPIMNATKLTTVQHLPVASGNCKEFLQPKQLCVGSYPSNTAAPGSGGHRRRSSVILNRRPPPIRHTESVELERTGSKLTLDEELFDIINAFLEADRDKEDEDEPAERGKPLTRQNLLNKIREKKEVINKLRCQAWNMNRKRRTLRLAQKYLEQNEPKVSRSHVYKEELFKRWRQFLRWFSNIWIYFVPWESRIKRIESQFGSVVSSYFVFLRWVIFINFIVTIIILSSVVVPECIADAMAEPSRQNRTAGRKHIPIEELAHADEIAVVWHFDGYLRFSPLFYGFYSNDSFIHSGIAYPLPLAYFLTAIFVFCFSLFLILRKVALNTRNSKLTGTKAEQYIFNWKLFTGWDFSIGNPETATNTAMAVVIKLREAINENKSHARRRCNPSLWAIRVVTNSMIIGMIALSVYCIHAAMRSSETVEKSSGSLFTKNQVPLLMSTITHIFPMVFDLIGRAEKHQARTALRLHLVRISVLYFINYSTLMLSLFEKLDNIRDISRTVVTTTSGVIKQELMEDGQGHDRHEQHFLSRNFSSPRLMGQFFLRALQQRPNRAVLVEMTTATTDAWSSVLNSSISSHSLPFSSTMGSTAVGSSSVTVHAQFGPIAVNNPSALRRNESRPPVGLSQILPYETTRLGPSPLPLFTVQPPLSPGPQLSTFRAQDFGPHWEAIQRERERARKQPTISPKPTPANITVQRPIHGLPYAKMEKIERSRSSIGGTTGSPSLWTKKSSHSPHRPHSSSNHHGGSTTTLYPPMTTAQGGKEGSNLYTKSAEQRVEEEGEEAEDVIYDESICWETMIGQEIARLVTMDLYITIASIFIIDFLRGIWIRYCSSWWCWDIETTFPEYGEFKVAENVLHICNNQGMIWLGLFFAPLLPAFNNFKLIIILYIRGWSCSTCNVPGEIFRASRSSSFFLYILLGALLLCTAPVGYVITFRRPSILCGPFAGKKHFYSVITDLIEAHLSRKVLRWLRILTSPGVIFPIILLMILFIFFLFSMVRGLRKANTDLQKQLIHERTEEKRKIFELAGGGGRKKAGVEGAAGHTLQPTAAAMTAGGSGNHCQHRRKTPSGQYLPSVERKRREPWRLFNSINHKDGEQIAPSLCPSDEPPSSLNSPTSSNGGNIPRTIASLGSVTQPKGVIQPECNTDVRRPLGTHTFRPSLGLLDDAVDSVGAPSSITSDMNGQQSLNVPSHNGRNPESNRRSSPSPSLQIKGTPEEIRILIAPYQQQHEQRRKLTSSVGFPPLAVLFTKRSSLNGSSNSADGSIQGKKNRSGNTPQPKMNNRDVKDSLTYSLGGSDETVGFASVFSPAGLAFR